MLESKSDFKEYDAPFQLEQSLSFYCWYSQEYYTKRNIFFKQVVVSTDDGVIFRSKRKDISLTFEGTIQKQRTRMEDGAPLGSIAYELDRSALLIERRYPTFLDMISRFGGISRVITFIIFSFVSLHHLVTMEQYLLNEAVLQKHKEITQSSSKTIEKVGEKEEFQEVEMFGYLEVFKLKFLFCLSKNSQRKRQHEQLTKVL